MTAPDHPAMRTFGRVQSRPLKPRQAALMATLLPQLALPEGPLDPQALAPGAAQVWLAGVCGPGAPPAPGGAPHRNPFSPGPGPLVRGTAPSLPPQGEATPATVR